MRVVILTECPMANLHVCSTLLSKERLPTTAGMLSTIPEPTLGVPRVSCLISYNELRERSMIEMYDRQIINSGENQASTIKTKTYERSLQESEKLSKEHPIKYD